MGSIRRGINIGSLVYPGLLLVLLLISLSYHRGRGAHAALHKPKPLITGTSSFISRHNYGVVFEKVGQLLGSGETTYYTTIGIPIPAEMFDLSSRTLNRNRCQTVGDHRLKCDQINKIIDQVNSNCMNIVRQSAAYVKSVLRMIPKSEHNHESRKDHDRTRKRRSTDFANAPQLFNPHSRLTNSKRKSNTISNLFDSLNSSFPIRIHRAAGSHPEPEPVKYLGRKALHATTNVLVKEMQYMPGTHVIGSIATGLFGMPSMEVANKIADHISMINKAAATLTKGVIEHENMQSSVFINWNDKFDLQSKASKAVAEKANEVARGIEDMARQDYINVNSDIKKISLLSKLATTMLVELYPELFRFHCTCMEMNANMQQFTDGIMTLVRGFLPKTLVTHGIIQEVLNNIKQNVLNKGAFSLFEAKLVNENPAFYYSVKGTTMYTQDDKFIYITLAVPISHSGGILNLFRVYSFDVDVRSGTVPKATKQRPGDYKTNNPQNTGRTKVSNAADYLAITDDSEYYFTMSRQEFRNCKTTDPNSGSLHVCQNMQKALVHNTVQSCTTALYIDSAYFIRRECIFLHTSTMHNGGAIQVAQSNLFLVQASTIENDVWTLNCPFSDRPVRHVTPQVFALISIPCLCSLSARGFYLQSLLSGCDTDSLVGGVSSLTELSVHLPVNAFMLQNMMNTYAIDLDRINGDSVRSLSGEGLWPNFEGYLIPLNIPLLHWNITIDDIARRVGKYTLDMTKAAALTKRRIPIWVSQIDKALNKSMDFSDIDASFARKGPLKAFKDLLNIFPTAHDLVVALTSGGFLSLIALCITSIMFLAKYRLCGLGALLDEEKPQHNKVEMSEEVELLHTKENEKTITI